MTYWGLNAIFLGIVAVIGCGALAIARRRPPGVRAVSVVSVLLILLLVSAVFDNIMIGVGLVGYDSAKISGAFIGRAPLEDFAYPVAAVLLLPALWVLLGRRRHERG